MRKYIVDMTKASNIILTYNCPPQAGQVFFYREINETDIEKILEKSDFSEAKQVIAKLMKK